MEVFSTVIFILELAALAGLVICGALLILNAGSRAKRPEDEPEQPEQIKGRYNIYYPLDKKRKCKRRPKGQTGRKHPKGKREV